MIPKQRLGSLRDSAGSAILAVCKGEFKVSSDTAAWYTSSYGTDFDNPGIASPAVPGKSQRSPGSIRGHTPALLHISS